MYKISKIYFKMSEWYKGKHKIMETKYYSLSLNMYD